MNTQYKLFILTLLITNFAAAQEKKEDKKSKPGAAVYISLQLVRTDGSQVFFEQDLPDPKGKAVAQTYTVMVPVPKTVIKDGKPAIITAYRQETRTRMSRPTIRHSVPVPENQVFKDAEGKTITLDKLIGKLGMGGGKYVVRVTPGQKITPEVMKTFAKDTIFLHQRKIKK